MPMPWTYRHSQREFKAFIADAKERMGLVSDNMTYTAVEGVFRVFRARLSPKEGIAFASLLPSTLCAIFVRDWDVEAPPRPFADRATLTAEVKAHRPHHNLTPDSVIEDVACALRRSMRQIDLDLVLARIGPEAEAFWAVTHVPPEALGQRIV